MAGFAGTGCDVRFGSGRLVATLVTSFAAVLALSSCSSRPPPAEETADPIADQDVGGAIDGVATKDAGTDAGGGGIGLPDVGPAVDSGAVDAGPGVPDVPSVDDAGVDGGPEDVGVASDDAAEDIALVDAQDATAAPETTATADGFDNDAFGSVCPGGSGCPCTKHDECNIGLCVLNHTPAGPKQACAKPCFAGGKQCDITE